MRTFAGGLGIVLVVVGCGGQQAPAPPQASEDRSVDGRPLPSAALEGDSFELCPGAVVDRRRSAMYVMSPNDTIDAIDLATGRVLWTSNSAAKPLFATGGHLVAQEARPRAANTLGLSILGTERGDLETACDPVALPQWAVPSIDMGSGRRFLASGFAKDGHAYVSWSADTWYVGGPEPTAREAAAARRSASGVVEVDLATGRVGEAPPDVVAPASRIRATPPGYEDLGPFEVGDIQATVAVDRASKGLRVVLRRRGADGVDLPDVVLLPDYSLAPLVSRDHRHVRVVEDTPPGGCPDRFRLSIHAMDSGDRIARFTARTPGDFFVWDDIVVLHETPGPVGRRLPTGEEVWRHALRDTGSRYDGTARP